jgi:hypothetical protein
LRSVMTIKAQLQWITCHWQTLSYNIVSSTPCQRGILTRNVSGDKHTLSRKINICICKGAILVDSYTSPYLKSAISSCMSDAPSLSYGKLDLKLQMYLCNQCLSPLTLRVRIPLWQGVLDTILYDNVCQWHVIHCSWALIAMHPYVTIV